MAWRIVLIKVRECPLMKNVLVGNGFNLEIDRGATLSNRSIMIRLMNNCLKKDYSVIMGNKISSGEI